MQVQKNQNNNYIPHFQAVIRVRKNPKISNNVRAIVDKADSLYESVMGKKANINGVTVQSIFHERPATRSIDAYSVKLSKEIDGIDAELTINKPAEGTELDLKLTKPNSKVSTFIHYNSLGYVFPSKGRGTRAETLETYVKDNQRTVLNKDHQGYKSFKTYAQKNAAIEKYASVLLEPAEEIKKIFVG